MPSFASIVAIMAALSVASAAPLVARDVCGAAPTGTTAQTPLAKPTDIKTAALCMAQCAAQSGCECMLFGLVDNVYTCELFSVPASSIPPVTGLVAYDLACPDVPNVVPTASNPTGSNTDPTSSNSNPTSSNTDPTSSNSNLTGSNTKVQVKAAAPASAKSPPVVTGATHANPKNGIPKAGQAPLATPKNIGSLNACLAACKGNPACISYTFSSGVCNLYA